MGRAKFGVFGDGKELPQIAMSKFLEMVTLEVDITETKLL